MKEDLSPLQISLAKNDFEFFCRFVLKQKLAKFHQEWIDAILKNTNLNIMAPRGHFKTTILSIAFPLWMMFRSETPLMFLILSATESQSSEILHQIKSKIEENEILRFFLRPDNLHTTRWSETQILTKGRHRVLSVPFNDAIRGKHPDFCICDDILRVMESTNVEEAKAVFYGVVYPVTQAKRGKHIVVGTPVAYTDLLHDLKTKPDFVTLKYSAITEDQTPLFPEHFSLEQLVQIKNTMPAYLWSREYLCEPVSGSSALFPHHLLEDAVKKWKDLDGEKKDEKTISYRILACDVALSEKSGADWTVFIVLEKILDKPLRVIYFERKHMSSDEIIEKITTLHKTFGCHAVAIEQIGLSFGVVQKTQNMHLPIVAFKYRGVGNDAKRAEVLSHLELIFRSRNIAIPDEPPLLDELSKFGIKVDRAGRQTYEVLSGHDDCVMALAMAVFTASRGVGVPSAAVIEDRKD